MRCLVIVPTYNERENLPRLVPDILRQGEQFHALVVDDNSPDGTGRIADELAAGDPRVSVLHRDGKRGLGTAYVAGFKWALERGFDYVFEMDADFSHDPNDLPRLLRAAVEADAAVGSRWVPGGGTRNWSLLRTLISRGGSLYAKLVLGVPINDWPSRRTRRSARAGSPVVGRATGRCCALWSAVAARSTPSWSWACRSTT